MARYGPYFKLNAPEHTQGCETGPEPKYNDFDLSGKSLARVDAEAHAFGLSYGQYTAAVRSGTIIPLLKSKGIHHYRKILRELEVR